MISEIERKILVRIQDMPLVAQPFLEIAEDIGISEGEVMDICRNLREKGIVRRFGPSISHRKLGYSANPMTVLNVPEDRLDSVGMQIAAEPDVTHCYARSGWDYNLFFMIHAKDEQQAKTRAQEIVKGTGIEDYKLLFSVRELKKISFRLPDTTEPARNGGVQ